MAPIRTNTPNTVDLFECEAKPCVVAITECGLYLKGMDLLAGMLQNASTCRTAMQKIQGEREPSTADFSNNIRGVRSSDFSKKMKFPGHRQKSYAWDAETAIDIVMNLPGERARKFREVACKNIVRLLGGDQSLHAEIDANAASGSATAQFFQRAVAQQQTESWLVKREKSKETIKNRQNIMRDMVGDISPREYAEFNNGLNQTLLGYTCTTKQHKKNEGIPQRESMAKYMDEDLLLLRSFSDMIAVKKMKKNNTNKSLKTIQREVFELVKPLAIESRALEIEN